MSTLKKIIPTTRRIAKPRRQDRQPGSESGHSCPEVVSLARQKSQLERKLRFQIKETGRARDDANKYLALRHQEQDLLKKAEGQLSLKDAEIAKLKAALVRKNAQIKELKKKVFRDTSEKGRKAPVSKPPDAGEAKKNK